MVAQRDHDFDIEGGQVAVVDFQLQGGPAGGHDADGEVGAHAVGVRRAINTVTFTDMAFASTPLGGINVLKDIATLTAAFNADSTLAICDE